MEKNHIIMNQLLISLWNKRKWASTCPVSPYPSGSGNWQSLRGHGGKSRKPERLSWLCPDIRHVLIQFLFPSVVVRAFNHLVKPSWLIFRLTTSRRREKRCRVHFSMWSEVKVPQACPTLCDPMDCNPPGSSVHGILHARILEWVAISFSRGSSQPSPC